MTVNGFGIEHYSDISKKAGWFRQARLAGETRRNFRISNRNTKKLTRLAGMDNPASDSYKDLKDALKLKHKSLDAKSRLVSNLQNYRTPIKVGATSAGVAGGAVVYNKKKNKK